MNHISDAISKLTDELTAFQGDRYGNAVKDAVTETLMDFCNKSEGFARVIVESEKTLSDCIAEIMKGCGTAISDIEVFRRAVQFYCPTAEIRISMTISMPGETEPHKTELISIFDIL